MIGGPIMLHRRLILGILLVLLRSVPCAAHFGMVIPSDSMVVEGDPKEVRIAVSFRHPFEGSGMDLEKPARFGVVVNGEDMDLLGALKPVKASGRQTWTTVYPIRRPGVYTFYMVPQPYFEAAEDLYLVHYTKTVAAAYGDEEGWDTPVGLWAEIVPLTRPFGLYTGNVFQGKVLRKGKPVPHAEVEVELFNEGRYRAPNGYYVTQTVRTDAQGVFTYAAPAAGWWGFAALMRGEEKIQGKEVEVGAVIWVRFENLVRENGK